MVVPAVGIVPGDNNCGVSPLRSLHEGIDYVHDENLFVDGVGVSGVAILIGAGLEIADCGQVAVLKSGKEIREVVLVICLVGLSNRANGTWPEMMRVGRVVKIHEWFVVRNVVARVYHSVVAGKARVMLPADSAPLAIDPSWSESTLEPPPGDA